MARFQCFVIAALLSLCGCAHVNENSRSASLSQIETHLAPVLGSTSLQLTPVGHNHFIGNGKNGSGAFTINVTRTKNQVAFEGSYLPPAQGAFSGTTSWTHKRTAFLGFKFARDSNSSAFSTQQNAAHSTRPQPPSNNRQP